MKYLTMILAILLLGMLSCSDESLVGVLSEEQVLETGTFDAAKTQAAGVEGEIEVQLERRAARKPRKPAGNRLLPYR